MTENVTYGLSERTEVVRPLSTLLKKILENVKKSVSNLGNWRFTSLPKDISQNPLLVACR